jgi:hypothetical protein
MPPPRIHTRHSFGHSSLHALSFYHQHQVAWRSCGLPPKGGLRKGLSKPPRPSGTKPKASADAWIWSPTHSTTCWRMVAAEYIRCSSSACVIPARLGRIPPYGPRLLICYKPSLFEHGTILTPQLGGDHLFRMSQNMVHVSIGDVSYRW